MPEPISRLRDIPARHSAGDGWAVDLYEDYDLVLTVWSLTQVEVQTRAADIRWELTKAGIFQELAFERKT